jgi:hypothetical protein
LNARRFKWKNKNNLKLKRWWIWEWV